MHQQCNVKWLQYEKGLLGQHKDESSVRTRSTGKPPLGVLRSDPEKRSVNPKAIRPMARNVLLVLLVVVTGAYSVYAQEGTISNYDRLQVQINQLSSENYALKAELCNTEWSLYEQGLFAYPRMSWVCEDWNRR